MKAQTESLTTPSAGVLAHAAVMPAAPRTTGSSWKRRYERVFERVSASVGPDWKNADVFGARAGILAPAGLHYC